MKIMTMLRFVRQVHCSILSRGKLVLGVESTFDDSAAAVLDEDGRVLGESNISQMKLHKSAGGVNPMKAQQMHRKNLPIVITNAMSQAGINFKDLSALATATRPGISFALAAGLEYSKELIQKHKIPFIPVHHMEAHAITIRLLQQLDFPFLVLLASGGHCTLCLAQGLAYFSNVPCCQNGDVQQRYSNGSCFLDMSKAGSYKILGQKMDEPPGAVFDKVARELGLFSEKRFCDISGGQAIETLAKVGDEAKFQFTLPLSTGGYTRSCNFSFSGLQTQVLRTIQKHRTSDDIDKRFCADIAASFQRTAIMHIASHILRAVIFCRDKDLIPDRTTLVMSGGVASNSYFRDKVTALCGKLSLDLACPPSHLCTDNGIMIAWTGMEYLKAGIGIAEDPMSVRFQPRSPIGDYIGDDVIRAGIKIPRKLLKQMGLW